MKQLILIFVIFLASCSTVEKYDSQKYGNLNKYLDEVVNYKKAMGDLSLLNKGEIVYQRHFSFMDEGKTPIYRIGSISKIYTSVIILRLIEEGKLKLSTKLSKFYKALPGANKITIEHLLRHRSGLPNLTDQSDYESYSENKITEKEQIKRFKKYKLEFKPGSKYKYSNTGYILLSYIAERVSSDSFQELLSKYITSPLNLKNTYLYVKEAPKKNEVKSYKFLRNWDEGGNTHQSIPLGAGALVSTSQEVALFLRALLTGSLISKNSLKEMKKLKDGYGLGITTFKYRNKIAYGHTGGIDEFRSIASYIIEDDLAIVQLTNGLATDYNNISLASLDSFYGHKFEQPKFKLTVNVEKDILRKYEGIFSSKSFPLKLTFKERDGVLFGLASGPGQSEIPFTATSKTNFEFVGARVFLEFSKDGNSLKFKQGKTFLLKKE